MENIFIYIYVKKSIVNGDKYFLLLFIEPEWLAQDCHLQETLVKWLKKKLYQNFYMFNIYIYNGITFITATKPQQLIDHIFFILHNNPMVYHDLDLP